MKKSSEQDQIDEDEFERKLQFRYMQERRRSAPDIRRRVALIGRLSSGASDSPANFEHNSTQINDTSTRTSIIPRKHYDSIGKPFIRLLTIR